MLELDHKEGWAPKNWCFWTVVKKKTLESPLDSKGIKPIYPKENQPWIFIGRTDTEAEAPILWPPDAKSQLAEKDPDAGKDWGREEKRVTEAVMVGSHHWLNGHEFEWTPRDSERQESLVCCSPWGGKESDTTKRLKNNKHYIPSEISFKNECKIYFHSAKNWDFNTWQTLTKEKFKEYNPERRKY